MLCITIGHPPACTCCLPCLLRDSRPPLMMLAQSLHPHLFDILCDGTLLLQVAEVNSWDEAGTPCTQFEVKVTNNGSAAASSMRLVVSPTEGSTLGNSWNSSRLADDGSGAWCLDLPDWAIAQGLAPGANVVVGLIVKGPKPDVSAFVLEQ